MTWEARMADLWAAMDQHQPEDFVAKVEALAAERPAHDAIALFERAGANDSTGHPDRAVPLYRAALAAGIAGLQRRQAVIQLASSLRNLGKADESVALLTAEMQAGTDELDDAVAAFLALALVDTGQAKKAAGLALTALSKHLPRYNRSLRSYAADLI